MKLLHPCWLSITAHRNNAAYHVILIGCSHYELCSLSHDAALQSRSYFFEQCIVQE